jgi:hypothetical protein
MRSNIINIKLDISQDFLHYFCTKYLFEIHCILYTCSVAQFHPHILVA